MIPRPSSTARGGWAARLLSARRSRPPRSFALTWLIGLTGVLPFGIRVIGYLVPALLVRDLQRQGFVKTGISLLSVTALCALCLLWVGML